MGHQLWNQPSDQPSIARSLLISTKRALLAKSTTNHPLSPQIVSLLRRFGDCPHLAPDAHGKARAEVTSALSLMFTEATDEVRSAAGEATSAVTTINVAVLYKLRWARMWVTKAGKKDQYFLELFYELYLARGRWHQDPRKPFDVSCSLRYL